MTRDFAASLNRQQEIRYYRVDRFILYPKHWERYPDKIPLKWRGVRFTEANADRIPNHSKGVYSFVVEPNVAGHSACGYLLYVGKVQDSDMRTRYRSYLLEPRKFKPRDHIVTMIDRWSGYLWFYYAEVQDTSVIGKLEDDLLMAFLPPHNRQWPARISRVLRMVFS